MSTEANKTVIRRGFEEGINQGKPEVYEDVIAPNYVNHNFPAPAPGLEGFKQVMAMFTTAFPDLHVTIEDEIAEGDRVATRGVMRGTHHGEFMGIPATGKQVAVTYIDIWRVENSKGVENWVQIDMLGMMQQLGAILTPGQVAS